MMNDELVVNNQFLDCTFHKHGFLHYEGYIQVLTLEVSQLLMLHALLHIY